MINSPRRFGHAWVALTLVLACHVADEAVTDFLSVYNPIVRAARERFGWLPMPTFTFGVWLGGLCVLVVVLLLLSPLAYRGSRALRLVALPYAPDATTSSIVVNRRLAAGLKARTIIGGSLIPHPSRLRPAA